MVMQSAKGCTHIGRWDVANYKKSPIETFKMNYYSQTQKTAISKIGPKPTFINLSNGNEKPSKRSFTPNANPFCGLVHNQIFEASKGNSCWKLR